MNDAHRWVAFLARKMSRHRPEEYQDDLRQAGELAILECGATTDMTKAQRSYIGGAMHDQATLLRRDRRCLSLFQLSRRTKRPLYERALVRDMDLAPIPEHLVKRRGNRVIGSRHWKYRKNNLDAGRCGKCGRPNDNPGRRQCILCSAKNQARSNRRQLAKKTTRRNKRHKPRLYDDVIKKLLSA